jgi:putative Holliday junction resolvase
MKQDMPESLFSFPDECPQGLILAFDFGMRRIGLAIGQTVSQTASPLPLITATDGVPNWKTLTTIIEKWQPCALVVGLPMQLDGSVQPIFFAAKSFARKLKSRYKCPVYFADERLTSIAAEARIKGNIDKITRKQSVDSIAAQIMLEQWLQQIQSHKG